jgi:hypothetical protein
VRPPPAAGSPRPADGPGCAPPTSSDVTPRPVYTTVLGNPLHPDQDFRGRQRAQSRRAALQAGVTLAALASSWGRVHRARRAVPGAGGRMALVLPASCSA